MNITGTYKTQHGDLTIFQDGDKFKATYQLEGICEGTLNGNVLEGKWHNRIDGGIFKWVFDGNGNFTGNYKTGEDAGAMRGKWNGSLVNKLEENIVEEKKETITQSENIIVDIKNTTDQDEKDEKGKQTGDKEYIKPLPDANGRYTSNDGTVFEGNWENGVLINGKYTTPEGDVAEGDFLNMELHGKGKFTYTEIIEADPEDPDSEDSVATTVMKGEWINGQMVTGKIIIDDELYEEGTFDAEGDLHGNGKRIHDIEEFEEGVFEHGDLQEGKIRLSFDEGDIYEGQFSLGAWNGEGKYTAVNGNVYSGLFCNGEFSGEGKYTKSNGDWMQGIFENDEFIEGRIQSTYEDGAVYKGEMFDGERSGRGTYIFASGVKYEGEFSGNNFNGKGKCTFENGDFQDGLWAEDDFIEGVVRMSTDDYVYEGYMKNDAFNGNGKLTRTDGAIYEGYFIDGEFSGQGKLTYPDGRYKEGFFSDDDFISGKVFYKYDNGGSYEGEVDSLGEFHGNGTYINSNGEKYKGEWAFGERNGKGEQTWPNGDNKDGKWSNDNFISGSVKITQPNGEWYEGDWDEGRPDIFGRWENPNTGEFKEGMWDGDGFYSGDMRLLINGKLQDLNGLTYFLENAWAKEQERLRVEEQNAARIAAEKEADRIRIEKQREKEKAQAELIRVSESKASEKAQRESERLRNIAAKEREKNEKLKAAENKKAELERKKLEAEKAKTKTRSFEIEYKIKLTKAKSSTHYKGEEFGALGIIFNGGKTKQVKTHDRGETIQRKIRVRHDGQTIPAKMVKHYIESNDSDVKSGRAGTSTIVVLKVRES